MRTLLKLLAALSLCGAAAIAQSFTLTITSSAGVTVNSSPSGITGCGMNFGTCSASFSSGTHVTLTATPQNGFAFNQWVDTTSNCNGSTSLTCTVVMSAAEAETAGATPLYPGINTQTTIPVGSCGPSGVGGSGTGLCIPFVPGTNLSLNATAHDTTLNPRGNCLTLLWDPNSHNNVSVGTVSPSGGSNDIAGSQVSNDMYLFLTLSTGNSFLEDVNVLGQCGQVYNTGAMSTSCTAAVTNGACPGSNVSGPLGFSKVSGQQNIFYSLSGNNCTGCSAAPIVSASNSSYSVLYKGVINCGYKNSPCAPNTAVNYTMSALFDFRNCPGLGSSAASLQGQSSSVLSIHGYDQQFSQSESFTGGQGTAISKMIYDPNQGCLTFDTSTGYVYGWCNSFPCDSTVGPLNAYYDGQETLCYGGGMHDSDEKTVQFSKVSTKANSWTQCPGIISAGVDVVWDTFQTPLVSTGTMTVSGGTSGTVISGSTPQSYWVGVTGASAQNNIVINGTANEIIGVSGSNVTLGTSISNGTYSFTIKSLCNATPCPNGASWPTVNLCGGGPCTGHPSAGYTGYTIATNPKPNFRSYPNFLTQGSPRFFADLPLNDHPLLLYDPLQLDLGAYGIGVENNSNPTNPFGFDNPPVTLYENSLIMIPAWQNFTYTSTNPTISYVTNLWNAVSLTSNVTALTLTSTTATVTTGSSGTTNIYPACATVSGSCGGGVGLELTVTGCGSTVTGNLTSVSANSFTMSGSFTAGSPSCSSGQSSAALTFGPANSICYPTLDTAGVVEWVVCGYNGYGQLGADSSQNVFGSAILINLSGTLPAPAPAIFADDDWLPGFLQPSADDIMSNGGSFK